jgi:diguanylate cyclase (GGDEF)-like protein
MKKGVLLLFIPNLNLHVYSVSVLLIIWFSYRKSDDAKSLNTRLISLIIGLTVFLLLADLVSRLEGRQGGVFYVLNAGGNFLQYFFGPILPALWFMYVHNQIFSDDLGTLRFINLFLVILCINTALLVLTQFFGWYYYIDAQNIYHRGKLFFIPLVMDLLILLSPYPLLFKNRKRIEQKYYRSLVFFGIPPLICLILQVFNYGMAYVLNGVAISLIIMNISTQNRRMNIDYLTGAFNRKQLDQYLTDKIRKSSGSKTFSVIMLDMDEFKRINDSYGHGVGDDALITLVRLLKKCTRRGDFIARFGGDEFFIVMDISDMRELQEVIYRIEDCIRAFNESGLKPYRLSFSMGYMIYDTNNKPDVDEFKAQLDKRMYLCKTADRGW